MTRLNVQHSLISRWPISIEVNEEANGETPYGLDAPRRIMAKHHAWRKCVDCGIQCTPMNFVDVDKERICLACWTARVNPEHPEMEAIIEKVEAEVEVWRCQKHTLDDYALPDGPKSVRSQGNRVDNP